MNKGLLDNRDLELVYKYYGEKMMNLCRRLFPLLIENNRLFEVLSSSFAPSKHLFDDVYPNLVDDFKNYIYGIAGIKVNKTVSTKSPEELLKSVGYTLYECHSNDDIQAFRRYYGKKEELCTFRDEKRLDNNYVFFAVADNADIVKAKRIPQREDSYGRSVLSIQFSRGMVNNVSIVSRYNHLVPNPDGAFICNLDNIVEGLTNSFERKYNLKIESDVKSFEFPGYVKASDGKFYKYNYLINDIYYCPDNIIIDHGEVIKYKPEEYILMDYFLLDIRKKKIISLYDRTIEDSFLNNLEDIDSVTVNNLDDNKKKIVINNSIVIILNKWNQIVEYENLSATKIGNDFMKYNLYLEKINIPLVESIGNDFLPCNYSMREIYLPSVVKIGDEFLFCNEILEVFDAPNLEQFGDWFMYSNVSLNSLYIPNASIGGRGALYYDSSLKYVNAPELILLGGSFGLFATDLEELYMPKLRKLGSGFLNGHKNYNIRVDLSSLDRKFYRFLPYYIRSIVESTNTHYYVRGLSKRISRR